MNGCAAPGCAGRPRTESGWRRCISSKMATARSSGAAFSIGTISVIEEIGQRIRAAAAADPADDRTAACDRCSKRYAVAALIDAFAAATDGDVCLSELHVEPHLVIGDMAAGQRADPR